MICIARIFGAPDSVPAGKPGRQRVDRVEALAQFAFDVRNQMHHMRIALDEETVRHLDAADFRHAAHIVASEIEQHQMLGALLGIGHQLVRKARIVFRRCTAPARAGDGPDRHRAVAQPHQNLGARTHDREARKREMIEEWRRIEPAKRAIERERRQREGPAEALARHHLENIACANVFLRAFNDVEIFVMRHDWNRSRTCSATPLAKQARPARRARDRRWRRSIVRTPARKPPAHRVPSRATRAIRR